MTLRILTELIYFRENCRCWIQEITNEIINGPKHFCYVHFSHFLAFSSQTVQFFFKEEEKEQASIPVQRALMEVISLSGPLNFDTVWLKRFLTFVLFHNKIKQRRAGAAVKTLWVHYLSHSFSLLELNVNKTSSESNDQVLIISLVIKLGLRL